MSTEKIKNTYSEETRLALLEQSINNINNTLMRFEKRFDDIQSEGKSHHRWCMGGIFGTYAIIISSIITFIIKFSH
jgi:hypothetical protein